MLVAGCGAKAVSLREPGLSVIAAEYVDLVKRWTRHGHLREDFDIALDVHATLRAPEFRAAYAAKYIEVYRVAPQAAAQRREELLSEFADSYEFHIESQTHTYELNDFQPTKKIWRLSLLNDRNQEVLPIEVASLKDRPEVVTVFYPYASLFSRSWRIRFPRQLPDGTALIGEGSRSLTLRFAGPQGTVDLTWRLR
jgi:hypothetical protein